MFQVVTSGLLDPMCSPVPGPQVAGSPAGSGVVAQDVPAPALTLEEEFDLFGPPDDQPLQRIVEQQVLGSLFRLAPVQALSLPGFSSSFFPRARERWTFQGGFRERSKGGLKGGLLKGASSELLN